MQRKFFWAILGELFCSSRLEQTGSTFELARMSNFLKRHEILGKLICSSRLEQTAQTFESTRMSSNRQFGQNCSARADSSRQLGHSSRLECRTGVLYKTLRTPQMPFQKFLNPNPNFARAILVLKP